MPPRKRPLSEADPNASRLAQNPKSAKTGTRKNGRKSAGEIGIEAEEEKPIVPGSRSSTQSMSSKPPSQSPPKCTKSRHAIPHERPSQRSSRTKPALHTQPQRQSKRKGNPGGVDSGAADISRDEEIQDHGLHSSTIKESPTSKEELDYKTKDNSKLRSMLVDRDLSTSGTREELIARLERSSIDYRSYSSEELTDMLRRRNVIGAAQGTKAIKIERLKLNDKLDRDTGTGSDSMLYVHVSVKEMMLNDLLARQKSALVNSPYSSKSLAQLSRLLEKKKLSCSGSRESMITRLETHDAKTLVKDIAKFRKEYDSGKRKLEAQIGHPVNVSEVTQKEDELRAIDYKIQAQAQRSQPGIPICDYNWKESHWASRTERQLSEICSRREMPGHGPKATMIKWLETGSVEYEDLYASSLEMICMKRGVKHRSGDKKVDLIRRLKEADELEGME